MERPSLEFPITLGGEKVDVKMSYGLFTEIMQVVPKPEDIGALMMTDAGLRDYLVRRVLTGNKKVVTDADLIDPFEMDVDIEEINNLVLWIADHVLYFFMNSGAKTAQLGKKYEAEIVQLAQSNSGAQS